MESKDESRLGLLDLPQRLIEYILSYFSFDEVTHLRLICRDFDRICQLTLNRGFMSVDRYHAKCLREVRTMLPRRESRRRNHPLARHCDILTAVETRLSLLGMTFMKYVDMNLCCFIPGKVIDEIYRVLRFIQGTTTPPRAHEILQELRDISSMAMEHFDEKIVPRLKDKMVGSQSQLSMASSSTYSLASSNSILSPTTRLLLLPQSMQRDLVKLQHTSKQANSVISGLKSDLAACRNKILEQKKCIQQQDKKIVEQSQHLAKQNAKLAEHEAKITELKRKHLEFDQKFSDLVAEWNRCREEYHRETAHCKGGNHRRTLDAESSSMTTLHHILCNTVARKRAASRDDISQVEDGDTKRMKVADVE